MSFDVEITEAPAESGPLGLSGLFMPRDLVVAGQFRLRSRAEAEAFMGAVREASSALWPGPLEPPAE